MYGMKKKKAFKVLEEHHWKKDISELDAEFSVKKKN